ncbi:hypothetical protein H257_12069 [Aphanomyces astaci]|uniref:Uncharacterized protein n=1 Tax=Aphanomyces astaci TaxID=112090 RepID=W4G173_APHAT|nr:hypothetical protein H257_12069 [Aphanomyces astaci]ETV73031.1 hypothetical protein H257_12069 [Aphanomyces astaci]|eukprot:XP_009837480.1 hypothetical protein H257_12069 [Aphanomyces astaci]
MVPALLTRNDLEEVRSFESKNETPHKTLRDLDTALQEEVRQRHMMERLRDDEHQLLRNSKGTIRELREILSNEQSRYEQALFNEKRRREDLEQSMQGSFRKECERTPTATDEKKRELLWTLTVLCSGTRKFVYDKRRRLMNQTFIGLTRNWNVNGPKYKWNGVYWTYNNKPIDLETFSLKLPV